MNHLSRHEMAERWRQLMVQRYRQRGAPATVPLVVMSYLAEGPVFDNLIELNRFVLVLLHEERSGRFLPTIRLAGYSGAQKDGRLLFGGAAHCRFSKDLALKPELLGRGPRLNLGQAPLAHLALRMESRLQGETRHLHRPRRTALPLPPIWAAFRTADAMRLQLAQDSTADTPAAAAADSLPRRHHNLLLFPADKVRHVLREAVTCYVDLARWPALQCVQLEDMPGALAGNCGSIDFDFHGSPFRGRRAARRPRKPTAPAARSAHSCHLTHVG